MAIHYTPHGDSTQMAHLRRLGFTREEAQKIIRRRSQTLARILKKGRSGKRFARHGRPR